MNYFIILFGLFIVVIAFVMLIKPALFNDSMRRFTGTASMYILAIAIRLGIGIVLLIYANQSSFPLTLQIIGGISILAGVILAVISRVRFEELITWMLDRFAQYTRVAALIALLFGVFLIYAVL